MNYIEQRISEINHLIENPNSENIKKLTDLLKVKDDDLYGKHIIPKYVSRVLLFLGKEGVTILADVFKEAPGLIYPTSILECLFNVSNKYHTDLMFLSNDNDYVLTPEITNEIALFASEMLQDLVSQSLEDRDLFENIIAFIYTQGQKNHILGYPSMKDFVIKSFRDSSIRINRKVITDFQNLLLDTDYKEEVFQVYLKNHPALIDPLAKEVIPKQRLGSDYITDYVIKKFNDEYLLVEIEKPTTPIFNKSNDFTSQFTHALGQILDFQEWVESNIAYAQTLMPNIKSPQGLLIVGLSSSLSLIQQNKLKRFNTNNQGRMKVMTFDEIIENSKRLYSNMIDKNYS